MREPDVSGQNERAGGQTTDTLAFIQHFLGPVQPRDFAVRLWDGTTWGPDEGSQARVTVVLKHPGALRRALVPPSDLTAGEAYIFDDIDIEGDLEAIADVGERLAGSFSGMNGLFTAAAQALRLPTAGRRKNDHRAPALSGRPHSRERDSAAIRYHYDVSNDFFKLWLDRHMIYSCAYFENPDDDLDVVQEQKLDYICRKLRLKPGERLLDIGYGWGGLVMWAASRYGADATGVTLSERQASFAREQIELAGLEDRCRVELVDYRDVDESRPFDKLVSVGMFEHVGKALLPTYFEKAWRLLAPKGVFLNHGISANALTKPPSRKGFSDVYVFPDGELVPISTTLQMAERAGFEIRDVESLREHYALTLRQWVRRLEAHADAARAATDDVTYRIWRLFMSLSAYNFDRNGIGVYQTLLAKPQNGSSDLPLTRRDWYA